MTRSRLLLAACALLLSSPTWAGAAHAAEVTFEVRGMQKTASGAT